MSYKIFSLCCATRNIRTSKMIRTPNDASFVRTLVLLAEIRINVTSTFRGFYIGKGNSIGFRMFPVNIALVEKSIETRIKRKDITYLIARYIDSFRFCISIILETLDRRKKNSNNGYKTPPTTSPRIIDRWFLVFVILSIYYLKQLTFSLRVFEFTALKNSNVWS